MAEIKNRKCEVNEWELQRIKRQIEKIQYGTVKVVIHQGKIVQVDTSIKVLGD